MNRDTKKANNKKADKASMMYICDAFKTMDGADSNGMVSIEDIQAETKKQVTNVYKDCRKKKKLTQVDLERITGIPQPNITRFENCRSNPTLEMMVKMAAAMGMELQISLVEKPDNKSKKSAKK